MKRFLLLTILGFIAFSCAENESIIEDQSLIRKDLDVTQELATIVAKNFSSDQAFLNHPEKEIDKNFLHPQE